MLSLRMQLRYETSVCAMKTTETVGWVDRGRKEVHPGMLPVFFALWLMLNNDTTGCVWMYCSRSEFCQTFRFVLKQLRKVDMK